MADGSPKLPDVIRGPYWPWLEPTEPEAEFVELPVPPRSKLLQYVVPMLVFPVLSLIYLALKPHPVTTKEAPEQSIPGWEELAYCGTMDTLDGSNKIRFYENQHTELLGLKEGKEERIAEGRWSYDLALKEYAITLDAKTTTYALLSRGDPINCILYKGDLGAADLRASWFSSNDYDSEGYQYDYH